MDAIFQDEQFWQLVGYILGGAVTLLVVALVLRYSTLLTASTIRDLRTLLLSAQQQVDEPTDPLIRWLDELVPGERSRVLSAALTAALRATLEVLDKTEPSPEPAKIEETIK